MAREKKLALQKELKEGIADATQVKGN